MEPVEGARLFRASGEAYDLFMGRYSRPLARVFADAAGIVAGRRALDVGCGPGALTAELSSRSGPDAVCAIDPSAEFVRACATRCPGVDVRLGQAESIPFADGEFDAALAQLVLHFVSDAPLAASELRRVVRPGGTVAACVWSFQDGMRMLRAFWDAALAIDPSAPDEARTLGFGREGEIATLFTAAGLCDVSETTLRVESSYASFEELWAGFLEGVGPAGSYCLSLPDASRELIRAELFRRLGSPGGSFTLPATAWCATGRVP